MSISTSLPVHGLDDVCPQDIVSHKNETVEANLRRKVLEEPVAIESMVGVVRDPQLNAWHKMVLSQILCVSNQHHYQYRQIIQLRTFESWKQKGKTLILRRILLSNSAFSRYPEKNYYIK